MACGTLKTFPNNPDPRYGVPLPRKVLLQVRMNGQVIDIPEDYKIPDCHLPTSITEALEYVPNSSVQGNLAGPAATNVVLDLNLPPADPNIITGYARINFNFTAGTMTIQQHQSSGETVGAPMVFNKIP